MQVLRKFSTVSVNLELREQLGKCPHKSCRVLVFVLEWLCIQILLYEEALFIKWEGGTDTKNVCDEAKAERACILWN